MARALHAAHAAPERIPDARRARGGHRPARDCMEAMMSKHSPFRVAALAAALALAPAISGAQDTTVKKVSPGEVPATMTIATVTAAVNGAATSLGRLQARSPLMADDVRLIDVSTLSGGDRAELDSAVATHAEDTGKLRVALLTHDAVKTALSSAMPPLDPSAIIVADVPATGKVNVFFWRK